MPEKKRKETNVEVISINREMRRSYMDYAMSVIVSRALPDVRDGLKPVHRRILYAMKEGGYESTKPYRKSARIVGDVMGKYHPHGDSAIYDSMVRMAQDFSMRVPLVDGHGNFGSMDGDSPAAMRYTEARMAKVAEYLVKDLEKATVDFVPNYDDSLQEPSVLPSMFPNLLVNGAGGIAVGMVTNIPPHNLGEVIDATIALIQNPQMSIIELRQFIQGPDFPTGATIIGRSGIESAYETGRGVITIRSKTSIEEHSRHQAIIVENLPYQVNKARLVERIAACAREKIIEGIAEVRDESDREGVRVVIEVKRDAIVEIVEELLFKHTSMQTSFGINLLALSKNRPQTMNLHNILSEFIEFRDEVVIRRTRWDLQKAQERLHIVLGLLVAISNIDPVVEMIKNSDSPAAALNTLVSTPFEALDVLPYIQLIDPIHTGTAYTLSEKQAKAILELRLQRLTGMEQRKLTDELNILRDNILIYQNLLQDRSKRMALVIGEMETIKKVFAKPRKTTIADYELNTAPEDLIPQQDIVITLTKEGYIKRVPVTTYRMQNRGGKGRTGMDTKEGDNVHTVFTTTTHTPLLFFTNLGQCYGLKAWEIPESSPQSRGKAIVNLLPMRTGENITAFTPMEKNEIEGETLVFITDKGKVRRNALQDFTNIRSSGKIAMALDEGETLITVKRCHEGQDIQLNTAKGMSIRFPVTDVRIFSSRKSRGVRGIKLQENDYVVGLDLIFSIQASVEERNQYLQAVNAKRRYPISKDPEDFEKAKILKQPEYQALAKNENWFITVTSDGYGLLASGYFYRTAHRGGKGIRNIQLHPKATVIDTFVIDNRASELVIVTENGQILRTSIENMLSKSRGSQGIRLFRLSKKDKVVSASIYLANMEEETLFE